MQVLPQRHRLQSWQKLQMVSLLGRCGGQEQPVLALWQQRSQKKRLQGQGQWQTFFWRLWFGGGRGGQNANAKAATKNASVSGNKGGDVSKTMATVEQTFSSTNTDGPVLGAESNSQGSLSSATVEVEKGGAPATNAGATELLAEATQLLKSLRMPNMKVMQLSKLEPNAQVLLDSGATHGLRPAASQEEWNAAEATR